MLGSDSTMADEHLSLQSLRKSLEALIAGERTNQVYFLLTSIVGLLVGSGLIWWTVSAHLDPKATSGRAASAAIPIITSALSVTRIAVCESKIAQYRAAAALKEGAGRAIIIKLIEKTLLRGTEHRVPIEK